jgi:hypothetical protein
MRIAGIYDAGDADDLDVAATSLESSVESALRSCVTNAEDLG